MSTRRRKRRRRGGLLKKYIFIVFVMVAIGLTAMGAAAMVFSNKAKEGDRSAQNNPPKIVVPDADSDEENKNDDTSDNVKTKVNVAVFGTDKDGIRTDVNFVVSFDTDTKQLVFLQVPRDTKVKMTDEIIESLEARKKYIPFKDGVEGVCKFNEVHAYAGSDYANRFSVMQMEDLLGINIDYYVKVDISGFRNIVDAIGGVYVDVPQNMYYSDPEQGLYINLKAGNQLLDGDKAEQLVRYRDGYAQKDLMRIQVQQMFMKELMKKVLTTETIVKNLPQLVYTVFKYVETDFGVTDALKYVKYANDISLDDVIMETIPGEGGSYFTHDAEGTKELVDKLFYNVKKINPNDDDEQGSDTQTETDSRDLKIEVSNGGYTNGLASSKKNMLEDMGYNVVSATNYSGSKKNETVIIVGKDGVGEDLIPLFNDAQIKVSPSELTSGTDIKIVLGIDEK